MKLIINKKSINNKDFVNYISEEYLYNKFLVDVDKKRLEIISNSLQIDCLDVIKFTLSNLIISESGNEFTIYTNKNLTYKDKNLENLINQITFGTLSVKGYSILYDIFKEVADNIDIIYRRWLDGSI